jgi:hypothetical protein
MLYDGYAIVGTVDTEAALEFMKEATRLATTRELDEIGRQLVAKARLFRWCLENRTPSPGKDGDLTAVLERIFAVRRRARRLLREIGYDEFRERIDELLYGSGPVANRFDTFVAAVPSLGRKMSINLAGELLHYTHPERYHLWTNWIWDPVTRTGALPLVMQSEVDLAGDSPGAVYIKVGHAAAQLERMGQAGGFTRIAPGPLALDLYLACVYAVYMYTVFRLKLSREFNRILPELPELTRRVLGVHKMEEEREA